MKSCELLNSYSNLIEAGCDEAGRGCLAGPVYAAAVILPSDFHHPLLNDSKQVSESDRYTLREIIEKQAVAYAVAWCTHYEIDKINILNASILAMHRALEKLKTTPQHVIVDGNRFKTYRNIPHTCIISGDTKYKSIAAASILAKTYRDDFMVALHEKYPAYLWFQNKGYATQAHCEAIGQFGLSEFHRKTFHLKDQNQLRLDL